MNFIDTDKVSQHLREKAINLFEHKLLITNFHNSKQEEDLSEPPNCNGYGRVRHFKLGAGGHGRKTLYLYYQQVKH